MVEIEWNEIKRRLYVTLTWELTKSWGENPFVRSSFVWLAVVPILVKVLSKTEEVIALCDGRLLIVLQLPFSWKVFFLGALCFALARGLYLLRCPKSIKDYLYYEDFRMRGLDSDLNR